MKYLNLQHLTFTVIATLFMSSCGTQDPVTQVETVEESTQSLEPTQSIDIPTETPNTEIASDEINYAIYTDSKSKISIMYPENWQQVPHENYVELRGSRGDVIFEILYEHFHELDQWANQYFSEPNYQEDSRSNLDNPSGYMSIGNLSDGARQARVIIGTDKAGLVRLEATADSEEDLDQHLEQFQKYAF